MEDDTTRQVDEIESLSSIYDKQWNIEDEPNRSYSIQITDSVTLYIVLPSNYPSKAPPTYQISAPELNQNEKKEIAEVLEETYLENIGENVIYQWVEAVRTYLNDKEELLANLVSSVTIKDDCDNMLKYSPPTAVPMHSKEQIVPDILHGDIIVDRKSTFQAHVALISSVSEVRAVLSRLKENKKIANAKHNIYAYRMLKDGKCLIQDCDDDGESQAGKRLLQLLQIMDVYGVVVIVTRWYGGIHLGPDRFRHINNAARQALLAIGYAAPKKK